MTPRTFTIAGLFILAILLGTTGVTAQDSALEEVLEPLANLDIAGFYDRYFLLIDFFLFLALFIAVARATVGRWLEGREGKTISVVLGIMLAVSITGVEYMLHFSVRRLGPIAVLILISAVGFVIFRLTSSMLEGLAAPGSIAFLVSYFLIRGIAPELFMWVGRNAPWIHVLLALAVIIAFLRIILTFWPKGAHLAQSLAGTIKDSGSALIQNIVPGSQERMREREQLGARLQVIQRREHKTTEDILRDLREIQSAIREFHRSDAARRYISQKLKDIPPKEHDLMTTLRTLRDHDRRLLLLDREIWREQAKHLQTLDEAGRKELLDEIVRQRERMNIEKELADLGEAVERYQKVFSTMLDQVKAYLRAADVQKAGERLKDSIDAENGTKALFRRMERLRKKLARLVKVTPQGD